MIFEILGLCRTGRGLFSRKFGESAIFFVIVIAFTVAYVIKFVYNTWVACALLRVRNPEM